MIEGSQKNIYMSKIEKELEKAYAGGYGKNHYMNNLRN